VTAFVARDTFCGDGSSISPLPMAASDGRENLTGRSWHRGSQHVAGERCLDGSARQPSSKAVAARAALLREPRRRPDGWNSRLRPSAGGTIWSLNRIAFASLCIVYIRNMALRQ
jgi:hypothetical protein